MKSYTNIKIFIFRSVIIDIGLILFFRAVPIRKATHSLFFLFLQNALDVRPVGLALVNGHINGPQAHIRAQLANLRHPFPRRSSAE